MASLPYVECRLWGVWSQVLLFECLFLKCCFSNVEGHLLTRYRRFWRRHRLMASKGTRVRCFWIDSEARNFPPVRAMCK